MSVIEIEAVSDAAMFVLVNEVFRPQPEANLFDRSVRQALLKEMRDREAARRSPGPKLFSDPLKSLVWVPEMQLAEFITVASILMHRAITLDRAAVGAFASGNREAYQELISCVDFVVKLSVHLSEDLLKELARQKRNLVRHIERRGKELARQKRHLN